MQPIKLGDIELGDINYADEEIAHLNALSDTPCPECKGQMTNGDELFIGACFDCAEAASK